MMGLYALPSLHSTYKCMLEVVGMGIHTANLSFFCICVPLIGSLNLVDLAGSERLCSSVNVTNRLKETQSINKSLSNLGNVIMALANRVSVHVHVQ